MKKIVYLSLIISTLTAASDALALSIDWTGGYRLEYTEIDRPSLADAKERKAYGLNFLYLQPKILASDGINIVSRFDETNQLWRQCPYCHIQKQKSDQMLLHPGQNLFAKLSQKSA